MDLVKLVQYQCNITPSHSCNKLFHYYYHGRFTLTFNVFTVSFRGLHEKIDTTLISVFPKMLNFCI